MNKYLQAPVYEYFVNGKGYQYADRNRWSDKPEPVGKKVNISYNPDKPEEAIIKKRYKSITIKGKAKFQSSMT